MTMRYGYVPRITGAARRARQSPTRQTASELGRRPVLHHFGSFCDFPV